ncbi:ArsR/SmtB family transcription factor [Mycetocola saprophilus]|uniref:ArsR/SmtB family transcription factor n=1 Tax=Mycetocola saprophilus TaxID=76636 RepID=UPI003BF0AE87
MTSPHDPPTPAYEARLAALEAAVFGDAENPPTHAQPAGPLWALDFMRDSLPDVSAVFLAGRIVPGEADRAAGANPLEWQYGLETEHVLDMPWTEPSIADSFAALANPIRLRFLQEILLGTDTVAELAQLEGVGTSGQVYHHLSQLQSAGWLRQTVRGHYGVPHARVIALYAMIIATGGVS